MQRVISYVERDIDLVLQTLGQATEQGTATSKVDTILDDISIDFGRSLLKRIEHSILNLGN